ncbi:hypothetical protein [Flagellimonas sp. CMM7]|uniref:hypothetical protein n=1 Tax=Flagellimonas sp. CMM7 TaxID=2654676 RepID=UPI0013D380BD|nr:hypothetical protein [Flagellimonas sp. CMM7]UII80014.1 hypothetical protein LV704_00485 [Flagellimonas sp. CMM7]
MIKHLIKIESLGEEIETQLPFRLIEGDLLNESFFTQNLIQKTKWDKDYSPKILALMLDEIQFEVRNCLPTMTSIEIWIEPNDKFTKNFIQERDTIINGRKI